MGMSKTKRNFLWQSTLLIVLVGVGGAFNVLAGVIPRAPEWMQKWCLEWLFRLSREPRRLFKRYAVSNSKFLWYLLNEKRT